MVIGTITRLTGQALNAFVETNRPTPPGFPLN